MAACINAPIVGPRRYLHSVAAFAACLIVVPAALFSLALAFVGNSMRFQVQPRLWIPLLVSCVIAAATVHPFQKMRIWVAALTGIGLGMAVFAIHFVWFHFTQGN